jgi:P-type E1-E2 ATPase
VKERFGALAKLGFDVYIVTGDIHGTAEALLADYDCKVHVVDIEEKLETQAEQKRSFVQSLGAQNVIAFGNGDNDSLMLEVAAVGVHVCEKEGGSVKALLHSDITVNSICDGLDLLLYPKRIAGH